MTRACSGNQKLNKSTLLAILPSYYDPTFIIDTVDKKKIRIDSLNNGPILKIQVLNEGSGYTIAPQVNILGNGGATATATIMNGGINRIDITNPGQGYTKPPEISLSGGDGSGAYAISYLKDLTNLLKNGIYKVRYKRIEKEYPRNLLLSYSNWEIKSFDSRTRNVCIVFNRIFKAKCPKEEYLISGEGDNLITQDQEFIILAGIPSCYYEYLTKPNVVLSYTIPLNK